MTDTLRAPAVRHRRFGNVRQLPNGRWQARWQGPDGHSHSHTFDTKDAAETWLANEVVERAAGRWVDRRDGAVFFKDYADSWIATIVDLRYSTLQRDVDYLDRYLIPRFGNTLLRDIETEDVRAFIAKLTRSGLAPATVTKAGQILAKILDQAVADKRIPTNPARGVKLPRSERPDITALEPDQIHALADAIDPRYSTLVLFDCWTGLRIGELVALTAGDIDLRRRRVHVTKTTTEVGGRLVTGPPKTKKGRRDVPMPPWLAETVANHLQGAHPDDLAFPAARGGPIRLGAFRARTFRRATETIGMPGFRIYDMRHTAITRWLKGGIDPVTIAKWAGHTSVVTVLDRYAHPDGDGMEALDQIGRRPTGTAAIIPMR